LKEFLDSSASNFFAFVISYRSVIHNINLES
jgi:hypothetical protein